MLETLKLLLTKLLAKLKSLLATIRKAKEDISEQSGELGNEIKTITNKYHFSRRVIRLLAAYDRMSPEKLRVELEDLNHGLEASGLNQRADSAPAMQFGTDEDGDGESNVHHMPAREAAE